MVKSIMTKANMSIFYWGDTLLTAAYALNRVPSKFVTSISYELWTGRKLDLSNLKPWGYNAYVHDSSHKYGKLGPRDKKSILIRYSEYSKGHVFINENNSGSVIEFESRDITFLENEFPRRDDVD